MRIFVAGHRGMVGSAICRILQHTDAKIITRSRQQMDLTRQSEVEDFFGSESIDQVYLAAARVGGIHANNALPADFIYQNLIIEANVIHAAHEAEVERLLLLGSSCIYPRLADQPMTEDSLLTGVLEPTNEPYAVAKIAGIKLCESYRRQHGDDFRSVMPTNLYGPGDNFHPEHSHVIPALLRKFHEARMADADAVEIWGSGTPKREFLHVDDMAAACVYVMNLEESRYWSAVSARCSHLNVGTGTDVSIAELAGMIAAVTGFEGEIRYDSSKPDGAPRKLLDVSRMTGLGWQADIKLEAGLRDAYDWMREHWNELRD